MVFYPFLSVTVRNDYARYSAEDEEMDLVTAFSISGLFGTSFFVFCFLLKQESIDAESGWKQVHGDVFRAPKMLILYAPLIGTLVGTGSVPTGCLGEFSGFHVVGLIISFSNITQR